MSQNKKNRLKKKSKLASKIASAAAAGAFMISQEASAQTDSGNLVNLSSLDGITNAVVQPDGSLLVELANGETFVVPAGDFVVENGQFLVDQNVLDGLAGADGSNLVLLGLGAAALAGIGIAVAGGGDDDDDVAPPPPVVEEEPAGPTAGNDTLTGTDGDDTIDGLAGNDTISGLAGNDTLIGGAGNDSLTGGAGDDVLLGGGGTDDIDGGDGIDTNSFEDIGQAVTASIADGTADYGPVNETFTNIENLTGTAFGDSLTGDAGDNVLIGLDGNDTLIGGAGNDTLTGGLGDDILVTDGADQLDGGEGTDTADFSGLEQGIIVDLDVETAGANQTNGGVDGPSQNGAIRDAPPAAGGQPVNGINLVDIENVIGTDFNDGLFGNNEVNTIEAGAGDDLVHGFAGDDFLDGGEGTDTVLFSAAPAGVVVDLNDQVEDVTAQGAGFAATGGAGNNVLSGFENVVGSQSDDTITGDQNDNLLNGNGGDDTLIGGGGADTLLGGAGDDVLAGGGGICLLYTSPSPRDRQKSRMPSSA